MHAHLWLVSRVVCLLPCVLRFLPRLTVLLPALPDVYLSVQREVHVQPPVLLQLGERGHIRLRHRRSAMPEDRNAQTSEHGDNSTWSSRGSEGHEWSGQEEESQEGYIENHNSYLGYNGMGHHDNEGISGITKGKGKGKKGSGKGFGKQSQGYCNTCGMWGHKAIDCKSKGKGKDSTRWYHGNKGKGLSKGGTKGFTKGKGKGMNNCEQGQRRWPATPSFHDLLSLEQETESVHNVKEKKQHSHVNQSTETRATSEPHQQWKVPVKWIQAHTKNQQEKIASAKSI